jgi:hypothetical protein
LHFSSKLLFTYFCWENFQTLIKRVFVEQLLWAVNCLCRHSSMISNLSIS